MTKPIWSSLAVRRKLKKRVKTQKNPSLPLFHLTSDSQVDNIIVFRINLFYSLGQWTIPETFMKKYWDLTELTISIFLLHSYSNQSQFMGHQEWDEILIITLISRKNLGCHKIMWNTVLKQTNKEICTLGLTLWNLSIFEFKFDDTVPNKSYHFWAF